MIGIKEKRYGISVLCAPIDNTVRRGSIDIVRPSRHQLAKVDNQGVGNERSRYPISVRQLQLKAPGRVLI